MNLDPKWSALPQGVLSAEQADQARALLETMTPEQALWMSGYLAGIARLGIQAEAPAPAKGAPAATLTILYGSETGNAKGVAKLAQEHADALGLTASVHDMADYRARDLKDETHLLIVTATHGEGDPPDPATGFYEYVMGRKAPKLADTKFSVLALGDSTYEHYCKTGRDFDARLEDLGATRLVTRVDCDVDYDDPAEQWVDDVLAVMKDDIGAGSAPAGEAQAPLPSSLTSMLSPGAQAAEPKPAYDKKNPFEARILDKVALNGRGSDKQTLHVEFSLEDSGLTYEPGDALGIVPANDEQLVEELIEALGLDAGEPITDRKGEMPLRDALAKSYEITALTPGFLQGYGEKSDAREVLEIANGADRAALRAFMEQNQVIDVVSRFPVKGLPGGEFLKLLRKLQPRLYSIASAQSAAPDEVHLTVAAVRYDLQGRPRKGVASTYLADARDADDTVPVYVEHNPNFKLPSDPATPIVMIGAGTGVAPYRAFMQERDMSGADGRSWLIFGDRRFRTDFLYQTDWQRALKDGTLTRMNVAFSRDGKEKDYVQHRILDQGHTLFDWMEDGAHIYVCGDANAMAPDVHAALETIVARESGVSAEEASAYMDRMLDERRYLRDVY